MPFFVKILRTSFAIVAIILAVQPAQAHNKFELDLTGGYRFASKVELPQNDDGAGDFKLAPSFAFSAIAGYRAQPDGFVYLSYSRQQTKVEYQSDDAGTDFSAKATVEYFQFGGNIEMTRGRLVPYLGVSVGAARLATVGEGSSRFFFAPVIDTGFKVDLHEHVHLRFLGRLPVIFMSGDAFCTDGTGCLTVDQIKPMAQFELHGGVGVSF